MVELPIDLPEGWSAQRYDTDCITIFAPGLGKVAVTVNYRERSFVLGIMRPRRTTLGVDVYRGRGWQIQLYTAAVEALKKALK